MIGYYVHHHGDGHRQRALAIAAVAPGNFFLLGTNLANRTGDVPCLDLPDDRGAGTADDPLPRALHYAPAGIENLRRRVAAIAGWIASARPALMVVDVSVETAMLARLASTRTVYARLCGRRTDSAHVQAFHAAAALLAPFHQDLDDPTTPRWIRDKTTYIPGLTAAPAPMAAPMAAPAAAPVAAPMAAPATRRKNTVAVILGAGGGTFTAAEIAAAAAATPAWSWRVAGALEAPATAPPNCSFLGWIADPGRLIAEAGIVIGAAGDGVVNAVLAARRPFICLPQDRPYDEQHAKGRRLAAIGAALTLPAWPAAAAWNGLFAEAEILARAAPDLHDPDGPQKAAAFLMQIARE